MLFIESLKRLYRDQKVTAEKIDNLVKNGTITEKDKNYILEKGGNDVHNTN